MNDYIFLMHNDANDTNRSRDEEWVNYFAKLREAGAFQGGSAIGDGVCLSKSGAPPETTSRLAGYIRVQAESLDRARELVQGNPVFEAGEPSRYENCQKPSVSSVLPCCRPPLFVPWRLRDCARDPQEAPSARVRDRSLWLEFVYDSRPLHRFQENLKSGRFRKKREGDGTLTIRKEVSTARQ